MKTGRVLNVQIGQFMDILCPQSSLMNGNSETRQPMIFDIFNVTKPYYDECSHEGKILMWRGHRWVETWLFRDKNYLAEKIKTCTHQHRIKFLFFAVFGAVIVIEIR